MGSCDNRQGVLYYQICDNKQGVLYYYIRDNRQGVLYHQIRENGQDILDYHSQDNRQGVLYYQICDNKQGILYYHIRDNRQGVLYHQIRENGQDIQDILYYHRFVQYAGYTVLHHLMLYSTTREILLSATLYVFCHVIERNEFLAKIFFWNLSSFGK